MLTFPLRAFTDHLRKYTAGLLLRFAHAHAPCLWPPLTPTARAGTELTYCALSLTAKLYLGWCDARPFLCHDAFSKRVPLRRFVLLNVVIVSPDEGGAEGALQDSNNGAQAS